MRDQHVIEKQIQYVGKRRKKEIENSFIHRPDTRWIMFPARRKITDGIKERSVIDQLDARNADSHGGAAYSRSVDGIVRGRRDAGAGRKLTGGRHAVWPCFVPCRGSASTRELPLFRGPRPTGARESIRGHFRLPFVVTLGSRARCTPAKAITSPLARADNSCVCV